MTKNDYNTETSGNWNSAKDYSKEKIMKVLQDIDKYEKIAEHGYDDSAELFVIKKLDKRQLDYRKFIGFKFLVTGLLQLISNSDFAVTDNNKTNKYEKILYKVQSNYNKICKVYLNNTAILSKDYETKWLRLVRIIKKKLNVPLNQNSLIFKVIKELSLEEEIANDEKEFIENP